MVAVVQTGGKQYKVTEGTVFKVEKLDANIGDKLSLDKILLLSNQQEEAIVGNPFIEGAVVQTEVIAQEKDKKVIIFKKKRRQGYRRKNGHRQRLTVLKVIGINKP